MLGTQYQRPPRHAKALGVGTERKIPVTTTVSKAMPRHAKAGVCDGEFLWQPLGPG